MYYYMYLSVANNVEVGLCALEKRPVVGMQDDLVHVGRLELLQAHPVPHPLHPTPGAQDQQRHQTTVYI